MFSRKPQFLFSLFKQLISFLEGSYVRRLCVQNIEYNPSSFFRTHISLDFHRFSQISIDFHRCSQILIDFHRFSLIFIDFHGFLQIFINFYGFQRFISHTILEMLVLCRTGPCSHWAGLTKSTTRPEIYRLPPLPPSSRTAGIYYKFMIF